jgi:hypothetical protein
MKPEFRDWHKHGHSTVILLRELIQNVTLFSFGLINVVQAPLYS